MKEKGIKHLSFHAYIRKLTDRSRQEKPLENTTCIIKPNCQGGHQPYPKGVCTKCAPPILTLNRQVFLIVTCRLPSRTR